MTGAQALRSAAAQLKEAGVPDSRLDAEYLLAHVLGTDRLRLVLISREELTPAHQAAFDSLVKLRAEREPLQYLLKSQDFMGLSFYVDEAVLIPRPETELLCEQALNWLAPRKGLTPKVLDLCAGSGALAVSITHLAPWAEVTAADLSPNAVAVARRNAQTHGARVRFLEGDFFGAVPGERFDLIVCNPPYIPSGVCPELQPEVTREPLMALDGGPDGLLFIRRLALEAPHFLCPGGALFCELGDGQEQDALALFSQAFRHAEVFKDLAGMPRILFAELSCSPGGAHV